MTFPEPNLDLSPSRWIWFPSKRCLPNTFILFRRNLRLDAKPRSLSGWLTADSRYRLTVNGRRVQWGPAPCDPRWLDADPVSFTDELQVGDNVIGVEVCYFGNGDGTYPMGSPGFICRFDLVREDGVREQILSDASWLTFLDRAHRPGMYKRWFLRALQEEFDARLHPRGWDTPGFQPDARWLPAEVLPGKADQPSAFAGGPEYNLVCDLAMHCGPGDQVVHRDPVGLRRRAIPLMNETSFVSASQRTEIGRVRWLRDPLDWFESRVPGSFEIKREPSPPVDGNDCLLAATPDPSQGVFATFCLPEQLVGWPRFAIDAPAGTVVELMVQESHDPVVGPAWLDTYLFHWSRFICREGINEFETFDYESFRWLQLHVRHASRPVTIHNVGARRRLYAWPIEARIQCSEPALQKLFDASINTIYNSCLDTVQDGAGRERQQYSGDGGHQLHAVRYAFGETRLPARYLKTFSQGMTLDGFFLDCWPAYDRLARLVQRQIGTTVWGPILDHGVGFNFDCWNHYWETGNLDAVREPYPRLLRFAHYLEKLRRSDGLLPVEHIGVPGVWIDRDAYQQQRHKQCAFNLYAAAMLQGALAPLARALGDEACAGRVAKFGAEIQSATVNAFWNADRGLFVNNQPWLSEEKEMRFCDRSLATAVLFDQCPGGNVAAAVRMLVECPPEMGFSYPCNAGWRLRALARFGRTDVVIDDFRKRWATMNSVLENNTLQECWATVPDSLFQWSHCPLAPLYVLFENIIGIKPTLPGFASYVIQPQLADVGNLDVSAHTPNGPIHFVATSTPNGHEISIAVPAVGRGEFVDRNRQTALVAGRINRLVLPKKALPLGEPFDLR